MKKIFFILFLIIILTACTKIEDRKTEPSIYKKAIDDSKQIQINMDKEVEINAEAIK